MYISYEPVCTRRGVLHPNALIMSQIHKLCVLVRLVYFFLLQLCDQHHQSAVIWLPLIMSHDMPSQNSNPVQPSGRDGYPELALHWLPSTTGFGTLRARRDKLGSHACKQLSTHVTPLSVCLDSISVAPVHIYSTTPNTCKCGWWNNCKKYSPLSWWVTSRDKKWRWPRWQVLNKANGWLSLIQVTIKLGWWNNGIEGL